MDFVENVWVGEKGAAAGLGAQIDRPAAVLDARKIGRIGVAKDPTTKGDKTRMFLLFRGRCWHQFRARALSTLSEFPR